MPNKYVLIYSIRKIVGEKYLDDLLFPTRFSSVHLMDTVLSHEAMGEDLSMAVKQHNWCCRSHDHIKINFTNRHTCGGKVTYKL